MRVIDFIKKQFKDLTNNPKIIYTKLKSLYSFILNIIFFPINFLIVIIVILLRKIILVRVGFLKTAWVGELVPQGELYLINKKKLQKKTFDIFIADKIISNEFFYKKLNKKVLVVNKNFHFFFKIIKFLSEKNNFFKSHLIYFLDKISHDAFQLPDFSEQIIKLDENEINTGYQILKKNIKTNYKGIVLYCVRDNFYNKKLYPNSDWNTYNYRNYDFKTFIPSVQFLMSKGYLVLRMGRLNKEEIKLNSELFIDYSFCNWKSDFMDFFLGYVCSFCITTGNGMDAFAKLNKKKIGVIINPISHIYDRKDWTYIFGNFKDINSNNYLSISKIIENNLHEAGSLHNLNNKFSLEKNTSNDILGLVREITQKHLNEFDYKKVNFNLQSSFWKNYSKISRITYENKKEFRKDENRICNSFLENNKDFLGL